MAGERYAGHTARVALAVGQGNYVDHDATAGRMRLRTQFGLATVNRVLPGGLDTTLPLLIRGGTISWESIRTADIDQQLCSAIQQTGTLRLRSRGEGAGLPEVTVPVVIKANLNVTNAGLCTWQVNLAVAGAITRGTQ